MPDVAPLSGRTALVCGATGAIGPPLARRLAALGARVVVHGNRNAARAQEVAGSLGSGHLAVVGDLRDSAAAAAVAERAKPVGVLVNAAFPSVPPVVFRESGETQVDAQLDGIRMHLNICRAVLPQMRSAGEGRIILLSGALAERPFPGFTLYTAAKAALTAFSRALALEEGGSGITVNVVAPGEVEGEAGTEGPLPWPFAELDDLIRRRMALSTLPTADDVAHVVGFLASPAAAAVTGQVIHLAAGEPV
jgi:NAD(P)-dependent dehydrogenase (short-subunit alcohol dehydrogenase family)